MHAVSTQQILEVWESATHATAEGRAQAFIALEMGSENRQSFLQLGLGERNRKLFALRKKLFGSQLNAYLECQQCSEALDINVSIEALGFDDAPVVSPNETFEISASSFVARVKLPICADIAKLENFHDSNAGRAYLLKNCILDLQRDKQVIVIEDLSESELEELENEIARLDPSMEVLFSLVCPECTHSWQQTLDINAYLWAEYDHWVRAILEDIHLLASRYGWSEQAILQMSAKRRQYYVQRLLQ